jgi:hypothetical protein
MVISGTVVIGFLVIMISGGLFWLSHATGLLGKKDLIVDGHDQLRHSQRGLRFKLNVILMSVGVGIISTEFIEGRREVAIAWLVIVLLLLLVILLAMLDAVRLIYFYRKAIPRIAQDTIGKSAKRESLKGDSPGSQDGMTSKSNG